MTAVPARRPGPPARNGLPPTRAYTWRARRAPWMVTALARAEAAHGPPVPTCACGAPLGYSARARQRGTYGRCPTACGYTYRTPGP